MEMKKQKGAAAPAFENEVILFGADHYNTLGVLRCLGQRGCRVQLLIHRGASKAGPLCIAKSRYAKRLTLLDEDPAPILEWLEKQADPGRKKILFPCSDFAAYLVDVHGAELSRRYILPGFQGQPGRVARMMDKYRQQELAEACGIPMAKSWLLHRGDGGFRLPGDLVYPCIFKPHLSAKGKKSDICVADTPQQALEQLGKLADKGYDTLLAQQYIQMDYEALGIGCIVSDPPGIFQITLHKLRVWPTHGGSTACACGEENAAVNEVTRRAASVLRQQGYRGLYDIDFFVCGETVYLNEVNFRNGAVGCMLGDCGIPAAYLSCLDLLGLPLPPCPETVSAGYYVDELNELYGRRDNHVSAPALLKSALCADSRAIFSWGDLSGSWGFYRPVLSRAWEKRWRRLTRKDHG